MNNSSVQLVSRVKFRPIHLILVVLFVGWAPSLLLAYISYTTLSRTLESKVLADAQSLAGFLSKFVEDNLARTGETMDYYRTLPSTINLLKNTVAGSVPRAENKHFSHIAQNTESPAQEWLSGIYYSQTRIDGLFLTDAQGKLLAAVPQFKPQLNGQDYTTKEWLNGALNPAGIDNFYISPAYIRPGDGRLVASIVVAIKDRHDRLLGFLGADTLIERLGRRLAAVNLMRHTVMTTQLIDQKGYPLFGHNLNPNQLSPMSSGGTTAEVHTSQAAETKSSVQLPTPYPLTTTPKRLWQNIQAHPEGGQEITDQLLYLFQPIERANWTAVLEEPIAIAHQPMHDMRSQNLYFALWLIVITAGAAYVLGKLYHRQLQARFSVEREQIFNEKILANMPVGIAMIDQTGNQLLQANGSFQEIIQSVRGTSEAINFNTIKFGDLNIASPDVIQRVIQFGIPFQTVEQRMTESNQNIIRYLTTNLLRLQDSYGQTLGVLCFIEDRSADLRLRQELIDANAAKDQFLAVLSHELRTPLSPVITMVAELEHMASIRQDHEEQRAIEIIRRNVELEARLIDDLLDITRITSGKLQLKRELVDVHQVLNLALEITQQDIASKQLQIDLQFEAFYHFAYADLARLQQIFWNLIKNAVKFTPIGKRIIIRTSNRDGSITQSGIAPEYRSQSSETTGSTVSVGNYNIKNLIKNGSGGGTTTQGSGSTATKTGILQIEVIDEGIGIEPANITRIFNAFDQGQSQITRRFGGLGLGLAISKAMIEAHSGNLKAISEGTGRGASFVVEMEAIHIAYPDRVIENDLLGNQDNKATFDLDLSFLKNAQENEDEFFVDESQHANLLLVDDHLDTCLGMKLLLTRRGYRVTVAHSINEALECYENNQFDIIVSDLGLPDGSGCDFITAVRLNGGPPAIALSGFGMESDIEKALQAGFNEHLTKPVDIDRLENALQSLLQSTLQS